MKLPPITDPRWDNFIKGSSEFQFSCLASRIMYGQVRILARRDPEQAKLMAWDYFQRNEKLAAQDLQAVFGSEAHG